VAERSKALV